MLRDAAATTATVLAAERLSRHARHTEVLLVKLPEFKELFDHLALLVPAADLRDVARVLNHGVDIEIGCQAVENREQNVQNRRCGVGVCPR